MASSFTDFSNNVTCLRPKIYRFNSLIVQKWLFTTCLRMFILILPVACYLWMFIKMKELIVKSEPSCQHEWVKRLSIPWFGCGERVYIPRTYLIVSKCKLFIVVFNKTCIECYNNLFATNIRNRAFAALWGGAAIMKWLHFQWFNSIICHNSCSILQFLCCCWNKYISWICVWPVKP